MLVNLQTFNVVICHTEREGCERRQCANGGLSIRRAAYSVASNHEYADNAEEEESDNDVAIDSVENEDLVADDRYKLEADEEAGRKYSDEVKDDADTTEAALIPKPFSWDSCLWSN
jgi:hypothetical protein